MEIDEGKIDDAVLALLRLLRKQWSISIL